MFEKCITMASMLLLGVTMFAVSAAALPDLTVTAVLVGNPSFINPSEAVLPLTVVIRNVGDTTGTRFKLSVDVLDRSGRFVKAFTVPGQADRWYPWRTGLLVRGQFYTFRGALSVGRPGGPSLHNQRIAIIPRVDSCSGDEFMAPYCRVRESNEGNNEMTRAISFP
jgi:hypothetical protein